jgi:ABC-type spermidine/putrescine transport system permease subunit II
MDPLLIPVFALLIPIVVAPTAMAFKKAEKARQFEHLERMRALELGRTLPKDEGWWSAPRISVAIGAVVPIIAMFTAMAASESSGYQERVWLMSGMVSMTGVISGTCLAFRHFFGPVPAAGVEKPQYDPDAFDVVGRRG